MGGGKETFSFDERLSDTAENILQLIKNKITDYDGISGFVGTWNANNYAGSNIPLICGFKRATVYGGDVAYFFGYTHAFGCDRITTIDAYSNTIVIAPAGATFQVIRP